MVRILAFLISCSLLASGAMGSGSCNISAEKKKLITAVLCGEYTDGTDTAYRFSGPGCAERSLTMRLQDSALQVVMYKRCGDPDFAGELMLANSKSLNFLEVLSVCAGEKLDIKSISFQQLTEMERKFGTAQCSYALKKLESRKPFFRRLIDQASDPDIEQKTYDALQIAVDHDGNITDK